MLITGQQTCHILLSTRLGVRQDPPGASPPANVQGARDDRPASAKSTHDASTARKGRTSNIGGTRDGPTVRNGDGKYPAFGRREIDPDPRFKVKKGFPWQTYDEGNNLRIGRLIMVAKRNCLGSPDVAPKRVAIKILSDPSRNAELSTLCRVQGEHFIKLIEVYGLGDDLWVILE